MSRRRAERMGFVLEGDNVGEGEEEDDDDDDEGEDAPEGDDADEDVIALARNSLPGFARKRGGSVRDRVKQVVHGALGTGSKGWRQSTLSFPKLST
jgi:hypothetical protein